MAAPHNPKRYGELWPQFRITALQELVPIKELAVFSGGWAWHFMSPDGHAELKHAHDHKDFDIFVKPSNVATVIGLLMTNGFEKIHTRFPPGKDDFRRYEKTITVEEKGEVRVTIDMFVRDVTDVARRKGGWGGWQYVEPEYLLTLYSTIHSSKSCFAVVAATKLLEKGIDPEGRSELVEIPKCKVTK
jgi:hypothetical protein